MLATLAAVLATLLSPTIAAPTGAVRVTVNPIVNCGWCLMGRPQGGPYANLFVNECDFNNEGAYWTYTPGATHLQTTVGGKDYCLSGGSLPGGHTPNQPPRLLNDGATANLVECGTAAWPTASSPADWLNWDITGSPTAGYTIKLLNQNPSFCFDKLALGPGMTPELYINQPVHLWTCYAGNKNQLWSLAKWS